MFFTIKLLTFKLRAYKQTIELNLRYFAHFPTDTLGKGINLFIAQQWVK